MVAVKAEMPSELSNARPCFADGEALGEVNPDNGHATASPLLIWGSVPDSTNLLAVWLLGTANAPASSLSNELSFARAAVCNLGCAGRGLCCCNAGAGGSEIEENVSVEMNAEVFPLTERIVVHVFVSSAMMTL